MRAAAARAARRSRVAERTRVSSASIANARPTPSTRPSARPRIALRIGVGATWNASSAVAHHRHARRLQRLERRELLLALDQLVVQRRVLLPLRLELGELAVHLLPRRLDRGTVELTPVLGEGERVGAREPLRPLRIGVGDRELEDVAETLRRDRRLGQQVVGRHVRDARDLQRPLRHGRHRREVRLRLGRPVLVDEERLVVDAGDRRADVLLVHVHLGRRLVHRFLARREEERGQRGRRSAHTSTTHLRRRKTRRYVD